MRYKQQNSQHPQQAQQGMPPKHRPSSTSSTISYLSQDTAQQLGSTSRGLANLEKAKQKQDDQRQAQLAKQQQHQEQKKQPGAAGRRSSGSGTSSSTRVGGAPAANRWGVRASSTWCICVCGGVPA